MLVSPYRYWFHGFESVGLGGHIKLVINHSQNTSSSVIIEEFFFYVGNGIFLYEVTVHIRLF
jgi:hypothetical protein